jgi:hypothetical protein
MNNDQRRYRVFVSYSHKNQDLVLRIRDVLVENGLLPMLDRDFAFGVGFHDQIKHFIEHAHVFLPVVTKESSERGWVHQEIGYAISQNIPVIPISVAMPPGEWLQHLHSLYLTDHEAVGPLDRLRAALSTTAIESLVRRFQDPAGAVFRCAELQEDRTQKMVEYANVVAMIQESISGPLSIAPTDDVRESFDVRQTSLVRQRGGLSSFHIPDEPPTHPVWQERYAPRRASRHHCRTQREERRALESHAKAAGCRIVVNPNNVRSDLEDHAHRVRLECLLKFLEAGPARVEVAFDFEMVRAHSLTLVGDWFCAEAVNAQAGIGYHQTIFTRHAPSMQSRIDQFDEEFESLLINLGWHPENSREKAIQCLRDEIEKYPTAKQE